MTRFLKLIFLFFLPLICLGLLAEFYLRSLPNEYAYKKNYLDSNARKLDLLIMGSSHTYYGINPAFLEFKSFNAAYDAQLFDYDFRILNHYKANLTNLKFLVLPMEYFTLSLDRETDDDERIIKNYNIYYGFSSTWKITEYSEILNATGPYLLNSVITSLQYPHKKIGCTTSGFGVNNMQWELRRFDQMGKARATAQTSDDKRIFAQNLSYLNNIIVWAKSRHIIVILLTSPGHNSYTRYFDTLQWSKTKQVALALSASNEHVKYYNFLSDTTFKSEDFRDPNHLNICGAKKLSMKLNDILVSLK